MLLAVVGVHTDLWWIRLIMFGRGICMAFAFVPLQAATYANITPEDTGRASAIYSTQRQVSAALGVGVLLTVLLSGGQTARAVGVPHGVLRRRVPGRARRDHGVC